MRIKRRKIRGQWSKVWYARVPTESGGTKLVSTRCADRDAARERARALERRAVTPAPAPGVTTEEACSKFLTSRVMLGRSKETSRFYEAKIDNLVEKLPPLLSQVTHAACETYIAMRLKEVKRPTVKKELRTLTSVLRHARRNGYFDADPARVIPEFDGEERSRTRVLSSAELDKLLRTLEAPHAAKVCAMVSLGLRRSETWQLQTTKVITVFGRKTPNARREVPLVRPWQKRLHKLATVATHWPNAVRDLARACARAGIGRVTPNDLRRTFGTWMLRDGVPRWVIAKLMGHTTTRMLDIHYGKPTTDDLSKAMKVRR